MRTIAQWMEHFRALYGERNECYFQGLDRRIIFLLLGIRMLRRAIKHHHDKDVAIMLASVLARTFMVAQHFSQLPFVEAVTSKYMHGHCSYCGQSACACPESFRPPPRYGAQTSTNALTLQAFSRQIAAVYGERNRAKPLPVLFDRLNDEVVELIELEECMHYGTIQPEEARTKFAYELADVLAWIAAIADVQGVDLEQACSRQYGGGCHNCCSFPCNCPPYAARSST